LIGEKSRSKGKPLHVHFYGGRSGCAQARIDAIRLLRSKCEVEDRTGRHAVLEAGEQAFRIARDSRRLVGRHCVAVRDGRAALTTD